MAPGNAAKKRSRRANASVPLKDSEGYSQDDLPALFNNLWKEEVPEIHTISDVISSLSAIAIEVLKERVANPMSAKEPRNIVIQGTMGPATCINVIPDWTPRDCCDRIHYVTEDEAETAFCCDPLGFVRPGLEATLVRIGEETWMCQIHIQGVLAEYKFWNMNQGHVVTGTLEASSPPTPSIPAQYRTRPLDTVSLPRQMPSRPPTKQKARILWPFPRPRSDARYPELEKAVDHAIFMYMLLEVVREDVAALPYSEAHEEAIRSVGRYFLKARDKTVELCKQIKEKEKRTCQRPGKICPRCGGLRRVKYQATTG